MIQNSISPHNFLDPSSNNASLNTRRRNYLI
jgi:hypothetical protein